jgi:hypothetical protein
VNGGSGSINFFRPSFVNSNGQLIRAGGLFDMNYETWEITLKAAFASWNPMTGQIDDLHLYSNLIEMYPLRAIDNRKNLVYTYTNIGPVSPNFTAIDSRTGAIRYTLARDMVPYFGLQQISRDGHLIGAQTNCAETCSTTLLRIRRSDDPNN